MIFLSVDAALHWAFAMEGRSVVAASSAFRNRGATSERAWESWTTWDRHAQAAMVRGQAESLEHPLGCFAVAVHSHLPEPRARAAEALLAWVAPHANGELAAYQLMLEQYVLGASGKRSGGIGRIRYELGCRKCSALNERRRIFDLLDQLRDRLHHALRGPLADGGLVTLGGISPDFGLQRAESGTASAP